MVLMKAIGARQFFPAGDPGCLVDFEVAMPVPGEMDLLVRVRAVSVNPVDTKVRKLLGEGPHEPPRILGFDAAGIVEAAHMLLEPEHRGTIRRGVAANAFEHARAVVNDVADDMNGRVFPIHELSIAPDSVPHVALIHQLTGRLFDLKIPCGSR